MSLTAVERQALRLLSDGKPDGGLGFGIRMGWTPDKQWSRQSIGCSAGGLLRGLQARGYVQYVHDGRARHNLYQITEKGREALKETTA